MTAPWWLCALGYLCLAPQLADVALVLAYVALDVRRWWRR